MAHFSGAHPVELPVEVTHKHASVKNNLLQLQEFENFFAADVSKCTHINLEQYMIDTDSVAPICLRHLPFAKQAITDQQLKKWQYRLLSNRLVALGLHRSS